MSSHLSLLHMSMVVMEINSFLNQGSVGTVYSAHVHIHKSYFIFLKKIFFLFFLFCFVFEVRGLWVLVYSDTFLFCFVFKSGVCGYLCIVHMYIFHTGRDLYILLYFIIQPKGLWVLVYFFSRVNFTCQRVILIPPPLSH